MGETADGRRRGRPSLLEQARNKQTADRQSQRWDNTLRDRVDVEKLVARLQRAALGRHTTLALMIHDMMWWVAKQVPELGTFMDALDGKEKKTFFDEIYRRYENVRMSTPEVKAAEILLERVVPRLAQVEHKGGIGIGHKVLMIPQPVASASEWSRGAIESDAAKVLSHLPPQVVIDAEPAPYAASDMDDDDGQMPFDEPEEEPV